MDSFGVYSQSSFGVYTWSDFSYDWSVAFLMFSSAYTISSSYLVFYSTSISAATLCYSSISSGGGLGDLFVGSFISDLSVCGFFEPTSWF